MVEAPLLAGTIAFMAAARGPVDGVTPGAVQPLYIRRPDAELARERSQPQEFPIARSFQFVDETYRDDDIEYFYAKESCKHCKAGFHRLPFQSSFAPLSIGAKYHFHDAPSLGIIARLFPPSGSGAQRSHATTAQPQPHCSKPTPPPEQPSTTRCNGSHKTRDA